MKEIEMYYRVLASHAPELFQNIFFSRKLEDDDLKNVTDKHISTMKNIYWPGK